VTPTDQPTLGIYLRILSGLLIAGMYVCVKAVSEAVPLGEIVFFRSFFALFPLIVFLWFRGEFPSGLATKRPWGHLARASFGAVSLFMAFAALARLNIAEAILIAQLSPIFMALFAVVLLKEHLTIWRVGGLAFGFAGVVVLVWPELTSSLETARFFGVGLALFSAILSALALIMVRSLNKTESPGSIALYFVLAALAGSLFTIPFGWIMPDASSLVYLIGAGLFGGSAHIAMTLSFRYAEASRLAPFEYVGLLWPVLADLFIFQMPLSTSFLLAIPLVLIGTAISATEGRKRKS